MKNHLGSSRDRKMAAETWDAFPFQFLSSLSSSQLIIFQGCDFVFLWRTISQSSLIASHRKQLWSVLSKRDWMKGYEAVHKNCLVAGESGWKQNRFQDSSGGLGSRTWSTLSYRHECRVIEHHWGFPFLCITVYSSPRLPTMRKKEVRRLLGRENETGWPKNYQCPLLSQWVEWKEVCSTDRRPDTIPCSATCSEYWIQGGFVL